MFHAGLLLMFSALATPQQPEKPVLQCEIGPLHKTYGGQPWLVYGCSDARTIVVASDAGSPANPFYFILYPEGDGYGLHGEGTGAKEATAAAFEDLKRLTAEDILVLIREANSSR